MKTILAALLGLILTDACAQAQLRYTETPVPQNVRDQIKRLCARFDTFDYVPDDPRARIAYGTERGNVIVLEYRDGAYQQVWRSPSMVTRILKVHIADLSGDGDWAIIAYNTRGIISVWSLRGYRTLWETHEGQFRSIEALTTAQVDRDPQLEILFMSEGRLYIYDGAHFVEEWRSDQIYGATDIAVGDVDGSGTPEIVLNTGFVLDAFSRTLKWESVDEFGQYIELVDIDGDGRLELIGGTASATKIWDVDLRREKWE